MQLRKNENFIPEGRKEKEEEERFAEAICTWAK